MKKKDLKETKIYLSNIEDRARFQKKMFSLGIKWSSSGESISYLDSPFYFVDWDLRLSHGTKVDYLCFAHSSDRQIFLHEVLEIKESKGVCKFSPFDRVLVRDSSNTRWKPRLFAWYSVEYNEDYPFETTEGDSYRYCIPYDEDLANTTKNVK